MQSEPGNGALLMNDSFYAALYLDSTQPASARIVELGGGGALITIFNFTTLVFASYPPPPGAVA